MLARRSKSAIGISRESNDTLKELRPRSTVSFLQRASMESQLRKINSEYGFNLSEDEIQTIARRAEEFERLFRCLYEIDLTDTAPLLKFEKST